MSLEELARARVEGFNDAVQKMIDRHNLIYRPRRWRDGKGVVHALYAMVDPKGAVIGTATSCGYPRRSTVEHDPTLAPTCLWCAAWAQSQPALL